MYKHLIKLADHLNKKGLHKEADYVEALMKKSRFGRRQSFQCPKSLTVVTRIFMLHVFAHTQWNQKAHYDKTGMRFLLIEYFDKEGGNLNQKDKKHEFKNLADLNSFLKEIKDKDLSNKDYFIENSDIPQVCKEKEDYSNNFDVKFDFRHSKSSYRDLERLFPYDENNNKVEINPSFVEQYKREFNIKGDV